MIKRLTQPDAQLTGDSVESNLSFSSTGSNAALRTLAHEEFLIIVTKMCKSKLQSYECNEVCRRHKFLSKTRLLLVYLLCASRFKALGREAAH